MLPVNKPFKILYKFHVQYTTTGNVINGSNEGNPTEDLPLHTRCSAHAATSATRDSERVKEQE